MLAPTHAGRDSPVARARGRSSRGRAATAPSGTRRGSGRGSRRRRTPDGDEPRPLRLVDGVLPHPEVSLPGPPGPAHRLRPAGLLQAGRRRDSARAGRVRQLRRAARPASSYVVRREGNPPDVVWEFASPSTVRKDAGKKKEKYRQMGVREYWLEDPVGGYHDPRVQGFQLVDGAYKQLPSEEGPEGMVAVWSPLLQLELRFADGQLRFRNREKALYVELPEEESDRMRLKERRGRLEEQRGRRSLKPGQPSLKEAPVARARGLRASIRRSSSNRNPAAMVAMVLPGPACRAGASGESAGRRGAGPYRCDARVPELGGDVSSGPEGRGGSRSGAWRRHAHHAVGRAINRKQGAAGAAPLVRGAGGAGAPPPVAVYGWKSAPKAPRIVPRVSPTPNASLVRVQLPMRPSGPSASWPTNIPSSVAARAAVSVLSMLT